MHLIFMPLLLLPILPLLTYLHPVLLTRNASDPRYTILYAHVPYSLYGRYGEGIDSVEAVSHAE
jgi:hypothetical protein